MSSCLIVRLSLLLSFYTSYALAASHTTKHWPRGASTRFYEFKVQKTYVTKLCNRKEIITINGEYWHKNVLKIEKQVLASGGGPPIADAYLINGHPGPLYNCSSNDVYQIDVVPGKTYLLRIINAALNMEHFFSISNHKMTIVEAGGEYMKPFTVDQLMITPGRRPMSLSMPTSPSAEYDMAMGPYMSAPEYSLSRTSQPLRIFQYTGASLTSVGLPAELPSFNDNLAVKSHLDGLRSLNASDLPLEIDNNLFFTIGLNVEKCHSATPNKSCQGPNGGVFAASMNNITFVKPQVALLQAYYDSIQGHFKENFPGVPMKIYDFVNGAPNNFPNDTNSLNDTRVKVLEYGSRVQLILQDTGTVSTENHPIHLHGYSFYVVGSGTGNYNPLTAKLNLVDPPYLNTIGVSVGGWAALRFTADNPGVWFMHCHLEIHTSWGLSMAFLVKNGKGPLETLPHPPSDLPKC
ncbi:hypothetical protein J5N97_029940 [Dioscorea zingiberensis]|uniref:laccase n=1 Tax=Dioscorea zingiberensis TaxID=325984 RepID=A0A9D5BWT1_9LILI|nr:hypothetical protein J5N97_029940 [Dioscorea zingiberensis]